MLKNYGKLMKKIITIILCLFALIFANETVQAQTLTKYVEQKKKEAAEMQRVEKQRYEAACEKGTLEAFKEYIRLYPKGRFSKDVKNRIEDFNLWSNAASINTIESYNTYIKESKYKSFLNKANEAISELQSVDAWKIVKTSKRIADIETFMSMYPKSSCVPNAKSRIHELNAVAEYNLGNLLLAYREFKEAGGKHSIEVANRSIFEECEEYHDYNIISNSSDISELSGFLLKYPLSKYHNEISNKLAIAKANELTMFSGEYSFNDALGYAKDESTRAQVKSYIDNCKDSYSRYKKQQRRQKHNANGKWLQFGFEPMDVGYNPESYDDYDSDLDIVWYYNIGLSLKIGNYKDPVQFEVGAKPGLMGYTLWYDYEDEPKCKFHLPLFARLKINLASLGSSCKMYMSATGYYNVIKEDYLENDYAISGALGVAWYHWDWSLYYKTDLNNKYDLKNNFLGTSLVYYF